MNDELLANRIANQKGYRFTSLMKIKQEVKDNSNRKVLDFGIGEQRCGAPKRVIKVINKESKNPLNHIYSDNGIEEFKFEISKYYQKEYGVYFNPSKEINHCIGIKSSLCILPLCLCNPNDYILMTRPGYVVLENMAKWLGAKVEYLDLNEENNYLFSLDDIDENILRKTKILYMNYPNNPTGQIANKEFYQEVISYAKKYNFVVVNDAAYIDLTFDKKDKLSFMQVEGAKDIGVEVFSFSKGYNMTGFRIGYILGNEKLIEAFKLVKDNIDSGQFIPIQKGAIQALKEKEFVQANCNKIKNRHIKFNKICKKLNLISSVPKATFYQYIKSPRKVKYLNQEYTFSSSHEFAMFLLKEVQIMCIPYQTNYLRFSMTFDAKNINEENDVLKEFYLRLKDYEFIN